MKWHLFWQVGEGAISDMGEEEFETRGGLLTRLMELKTDPTLSWTVVHGRKLELFGFPGEEDALRLTELHFKTKTGGPGLTHEEYVEYRTLKDNLPSESC